MGYFTKRYEKICPDFEAIKPTAKYFRVNPLRAIPESTCKQLKALGVQFERTPLPDMFSFTSTFSLSSTTQHLLGKFYLQGLASACVAHACKPQKNSFIIDLAAAPGSKTTHLAQLMHNAGRILAIDKSAERLNAVRDNCERLAVTNVIMVRKDARFVTDLHVKADMVLLDAPCSGNYCSEDDWETKRTLDDIKKNARLQKDLFMAAYKVLSPGGVLVYSTCSLEPEEDELIIDWALNKYADLAMEKIPLVDLKQSPGITQFEKKELNPTIKLAARFWPHNTGTEGFFIARLRKKE